MAAIRAGVTQRVHLVGGDRSIRFDAGFHLDPHRMPGACREELLGARVFEADGPTRCNRQVRGDILDQHFLLPAKATANAGLDHPDTLGRKVKHRRKLTAHVERHLRACANDETIVFIPVRHGHVRLDVRLLHLGNFVGALKNMISLIESLIDVTNVDANLSRQVAIRVRMIEIYIVRLIVDLHGIIFQCLLRLKNRR